MLSILLPPFFPFNIADVTSGHEWLPVVVSLVTAVLTVGTSFYISRGKQKSTDFEVIIDERKEFTEEIRKELKRKQQEYEAEIAEKEVENRALRVTIVQLQTRVEDLMRQINHL